MPKTKIKAAILRGNACIKNDLFIVNAKEAVS
jgi:hypothetical protein